MKDTGLASPPSKKPHHSGAPRSWSKPWLALALSLLSLNCAGAALAQADDDDDDYRPPMRRGNADADQYSARSDSRYTDDQSRSSNPSNDSSSSRSSLSESGNLKLTGLVTYWSHDGLGYHPTVTFNAENTKADSTAAVPFSFQARFFYLAEAQPFTTKATEFFSTINGREQASITMRGKVPFELSIDKETWPIIECKLLYKYGKEKESHVLFIERIKPVTMNDDDARTELNERVGKYLLQQHKLKEAKSKKDAGAKSQAPQNQNSYKPNSIQRQVSPLQKSEPEKPLTAVAASMGNPLPLKGSELQALDLLVKGAATQAGLGDDFYHFEKSMGMPVETDLQDKNWIWAQYRKQPAMRLYAGSKGRTGKADTIICILKQDTLSDSQIGSAVKALAGKFKSEKINAAEHSVRYVDNSLSSSGRLEFVVINGQSFRGLSFTLNDTDGARATAVVVSRLPGALGEQLKEEARKTNILGFLLTGLGESAQRQPATGGDRARRSGPTYGGNDDSDQ